MSGTTREVYVLADFTDAQGNEHKREETMTVAYETERQRGEVNQLIYRGFITLDVQQAKAHSRQRTRGQGKRGSREQ